MVLVTGGAGFIGSHFCKALRERRMPHVVIDNLSQGHADAVNGSVLEIGDLREPDALHRVFQRFPIASVVHFAGRIEVGMSVKEPVSFWDNNAAASMNLLSIMRQYGVERMVFSSTAAVYRHQDSPIGEDAPLLPQSPYARTKLVTEEAIRNSGVAHVILRYFNAAGCDPEGTLGERHEPETHLIPLAIRAKQTGRPLPVYGASYPTPDGTCVRDYVHVTDLAQAHVKALELLEATPQGVTLNLGTGAGHSVLEVLKAVRDVPYEIAEPRQGDVPYLVADPSRAKDVLEWEPTYSLPEMVLHTSRYAGL